MRTTAITTTLLFGLISAACGSGEPLPAMPEPAAPADDTSGGDLDSLDDEAATTDEAPPEEE